MLQTKRLNLVPFQAAHLEAYFRSKRDMGSLIEAAVPRTFPVFPETLYYNLELLREDPSLRGWLNWFFIHRDQGIVIGDGGFKGRPDDEGVVEIAYAIIPEYRELGFATEASRALVEWAFGHTEVNAITAETLVNAVDPVRVLERLGMTNVGEGRQGIRWRLTRDEYAKALTKSG